jgi:hypothetical protein
MAIGEWRMANGEWVGNGNWGLCRALIDWGSDRNNSGAVTVITGDFGLPVPIGWMEVGNGR